MICQFTSGGSREAEVTNKVSEDTRQHDLGLEMDGPWI